MKRPSVTKSTHRLHVLWVLVLIGLVVGGCGAALLALGGRWSRNATLAASDFFMVSETGLRLGTRSDPADIVLVHYGLASAQRLKTKPTVETDKLVYQNLLTAGAKGVADSRIIAALTPDDFEPVARPTLQMIAALPDSRGRLVRDVLPGSMVNYETIRTYDDFIRHDSIRFRSPLDWSNHSRLSPVADHDLFAMRESMALWIAQAHMGVTPRDVTETIVAVSDSGVATAWLTYFPQMGNLLEPCDTAVPPSPYAVAEKRFPWIAFASEYPQVLPTGFWIDHTRPAASFVQSEYGDISAAVVGFRFGWFTDFAITPVATGISSGLAPVATGIFSGLARYAYEIRWRNRMTDIFGRYVPRAVVSDLISRRALESIGVGGTRRQITVLFADIRGFTKFTESNEPETVLDRLNEFLEVMVDCTFENADTVDKFIGDAILVLCNAPADQADHATRAVETA